MTTSEHQSVEAIAARAQHIRHMMGDLRAQRDAWKRRALAAEAAVRELQQMLDAARKAQGRS